MAVVFHKDRSSGCGDSISKSSLSTVIQLVLLGFSDLPNLQGLLFGVLSIIYIIILTGNSLIIILTRLDPTL